MPAKYDPITHVEVPGTRWSVPPPAGTETVAPGQGATVAELCLAVVQAIFCNVMPDECPAVDRLLKEPVTDTNLHRRTDVRLTGKVLTHEDEARIARFR